MAHPKRAEGRRVPIYEYECQGCRRRVSLLIRTLSAAEAPRCPRCGSLALSRLMSRFTTVKSEDARLDSLSDPGSFGDLDENDPRSVAQFVKKMGHEMGEDLGEDLDAAMDEAMAEGDGPGGDDDGPLMDPGGAGDATEQSA
ncbi:MAG: FmdB family zinc ribbon protein [Candidatus Rokuibacteriota bacterium]